MICPHCKKSIGRGLTTKAKRRAIELKKQGYSLREMEKILWSEGETVSFASIHRFLRGSEL